jgi:hypothetical protein
MTKKISKIIVYYDDATYEEIKTSDTQKTLAPEPSPYTIVPQSLPPVSPYIVTCGDTRIGSITSDQILGSDYKYTITAIGNGNVDISK